MFHNIIRTAALFYATLFMLLHNALLRLNMALAFVHSIGTSLLLHQRECVGVLFKLTILRMALSCSRCSPSLPDSPVLTHTSENPSGASVAVRRPQQLHDSTNDGISAAIIADRTALRSTCNRTHLAPFSTLEFRILGSVVLQKHSLSVAFFLLSRGSAWRSLHRAYTERKNRNLNTRLITQLNNI